VHFADGCRGPVRQLRDDAVNLSDGTKRDVKLYGHSPVSNAEMLCDAVRDPHLQADVEKRPSKVTGALLENTHETM
jgi:hypothetical protein